MSPFDTIDSNINRNRNRNADISIGMPEDTLETVEFEADLDGNLSTETIELEPPNVITDSSISYASRQKQGKDNYDACSTKSEKDEEEDETDGSGKANNFVNVEDGDSNADVDNEEPKKQSSSYAAKKTVAQGMMDIALITANANQLRYIIEFNSNSSTYYFIVTLIVISLGLQVAVGMALIFKGRLDIKGKSKDPDARRINNYVVVAIFLVTIINVFIASFTITGGSAANK